MNKFFSFIIRQSVAIVLAVVFVLGFGVYATMQMPINLLPDINVPMVCVQVIYPGANAQSVEKDVTANLEEGLSAISGVTSVSSYSYDNLSAVVLSFDYGIDTGEKQTEINGKLSSIDLPDGVIVDVYDIDLNAEALAVLSVTSTAGEGDAQLANAYRAAEELAAKISAIDGVESVEIKGGPDPVWYVRPFVGLELTAPLFVQAFSYGSLDIPLGDITERGGDVQIRNNSDIASEEDIKNMPIALPPAFVSMLSGVKQIMRYYEDSTPEELEELRDDLNSGVAQVLADLDKMTAEELDDLAELNTYITFASMPASALEAIILSGLVQDETLDKILTFRRELEAGEDYQSHEGYYELTDDDCMRLAKQVVYADKELPSDEVLREWVAIVRQTSAAGLSTIADRKREEGDDYRPTDSECVLLFAGTDLAYSHPIIMFPTFMAFVRSESFADNMQTLIDCRKEFGDEIGAEQFYKLYTCLDLSGILELKLSERLINFILNADLSDLNANGELIVKVSDIATVERVEEYSSYVYFGGATPNIIKGTTIEIYKSNGANSSAVVDKVKAVYKEYLGGSSAKALGAKVQILDDQSEFISDSISNVLISMLIGGVLAVLVIFVFLKKVKTSLIIAITMPLSVLAAIICLFVMGITLNMVSLGGLAVGIGMLVDNSIVVIESISKHRDMDKSAFRAAVDGTTEVGGALFGSTVTTVCVFIPIIFSGGLTGEIFTDLSWAVIFSLAFSLIVAVTVIPALYAMLSGGRRMLKGGALKGSATGAEGAISPVCKPQTAADSEGAAEQKVQPVLQNTKKGGVFEAFKQPRIMRSITTFYGNILPKVLKRRFVPIVTAVAIFGASIGLLFLTGTEFLPSIDKGQIEVNMTYTPGTSLEVIQQDVKGFAEIIEGKYSDNIEYISASVGKNGLLALTDTGIITVQLKTNRGTDEVVNAIRKLAEEDENATMGRSGVSVKQIDGVVASLMSGSDDLSVSIMGDDSDDLKRIAEEIIKELEKPENGFLEARSSASDTVKQVDIKFDRTELLRRGLDYQTTVLTLRIGLASYAACTATITATLDGEERTEECTVNVAFDKESVTDIQSLKDFVVGFDSSGGAIKLSDVAEISEPEEVEACIRRANGKKMISVTATHPTLDTGAAGTKMIEIAERVLARPENLGYSFEESGISSYLNDAFAGLAVALVISFFLLYAVMAVQFGSALTPLIIMASIPFSFTGGFIALVITGTSLNVVSFIGLIMLMGVVVNNAIVMLEKIKQLHIEGMPHFEAVQEACKVRLRPIFMTTLTTVLALIPLAIGLGQGSELMQPLGIVVIGGLLVSTLVTLVLIPAVYCAVHRLSAKFPNGKKKS